MLRVVPNTGSSLISITLRTSQRLSGHIHPFVTSQRNSCCDSVNQKARKQSDWSLLLSLLLVSQRAAAAAVPGLEQSGMMGKLDEGLDDFFSKKVIRLSFRWASKAGPVAGSNVTHPV